MTNADEQQGEERQDASEARSPDPQEIGETPAALAGDETTALAEGSESAVTSTSAETDSEASRADGTPEAALEHPVQDIDGDAADTEEPVAADDAPDEVPEPAHVDPVTAMEHRSHDIGLELTHVETEVRALLQDRDPKRKRKLSGTARWQELEDDVLALRFTGRIDEPTLAKIRQLIARRRYLFDRLAFLAGTRPTWNT